MATDTQAVLATWQNFYLVTGTAAAALTALQFVTQTLIASTSYRVLGSEDPAGGIDAFGSPTVVHFTLALLLSALMCVPWSAYGSPRAALGLLGVGALGYSGVVLRRTRRQRSYAPVAEDWIWHVALPAAAYAAVLVAALLLGHGDDVPLFAIAAATLLLLCVGIHNAWDTVTYLTVSAVRLAGSPAQAAPRSPMTPDAPADGS